MARRDSSHISPTAHYTGYVWSRNGLADPALETRAGRLLFHGLQPVMSALKALVGTPSLEDLLMARHRSLEWLLRQAIESGQVAQVVEIAAGLSPRGYRMMRAYGDQGLRYIEGELPAMCARKRARLRALGEERPGHHVVELDALCDTGARSLHAIGDEYLDPNGGTAVITEGLVNYFSRAQVIGMWARFARFLARYPHGVYTGDINVRGDVTGIPGVRLFTTILGLFTRGAVHIHFPRARDVEDALIAVGFRTAQCQHVADVAGPVGLTDAEARAPVRIIQATMGASSAGSFDDE